MKDIFEAIDSRIKSPVFGYFILSMLALNWQPIFFLLFDDGSVTGRITYFNEHTNYLSLFIFPIGSTFLYVLCYPWIQYASIWVGSKPTHLRTMQNLKAEHRKIIEQKTLEDLRNKLNKQKEQEIIERAKRDNKITEIFKNEETREKVQFEIDSIRQEHDTANTDDFSPNTEQIKLLDFIIQNGGELLENHIIAEAIFERVKTESLLEKLENEEYIELRWNSRLGGKGVSLTDKGKDFIIKKKTIVK